MWIPPLTLPLPSYFVTVKEKRKRKETGAWRHTPVFQASTGEANAGESLVLDQSELHTETLSHETKHSQEWWSMSLV